MRRDLKKGCAACRLRFSERLTICPVCRGAALTVLEATSRVQPTSRVGWLAKWLIVLSFVPAIGLVAIAGFSLLKEGWPPHSALDIIMYVLGGLGTALGTSIAVSIPFWLWFGVVRGVGFILKYIVDRPRRALRVTIEMAPRASAGHAQHPMHRLWDKLENFIDAQIEAPTKWWLSGVLVFLGAQVLAEIFGDKRVIKTTSFSDFGESLLVLAIINIMGAVIFGIFLGVFGAFAKWAKDFLDKPPNLFGYDPKPPPLQNDICLPSYLQNRHEFIGHAMPLDEIERAALEIKTAQYLAGPLSGDTCLAFRLVGDADGQPVDDADVLSFAVVAEDGKRCVVTNTDVVVSLPAETKTRAENAQGFLRQRGLPERNLAVREGTVKIGELIRVVGRRTDIRVGLAGYRGEERRMMLDAGDGLPVVITTPNEATS